MAIDTEGARFFLACRARGVSFKDCITLGRQHYHLGHRETRALLREFALNPADYPRLFPDEYPFYSEPFWEMLGAQRMETLDASDFEKATIIHDLNLPIADSLRGQFDAVVDIGTIEHVFNFLVAIKNSLEMVRVGGHFLAVTPTNNFLGHGFYQFSPELFYRVLSERNGFQVERVVAVEYGLRRRWFEVADPEAIKSRVILINKYPVLLFVQARKVRETPLLIECPQQSDYVAMWGEWAKRPDSGGAGDGAGAHERIERIKKLIVRTAPWLARFLEGILYSSLNPAYSFLNRTSFRRIDKHKEGRAIPRQ